MNGEMERSMDIEGQCHFNVNNGYCSMVRSRMSAPRTFGPLVS